MDDNKPVQEKLIENYRMISLEQVVESKLQYINKQGQEVQDTYMLYKQVSHGVLVKCCREDNLLTMVRPVQDWQQ